MKYTAKRIGMLLITMVLVSLLTFVAFSLVSGDPAQTKLGVEATPEALAALRHEWGLDRPLIVRYVSWLGGFFTGDLGALGHDILQALFKADGIELGPRYIDCGVLMYDLATQNVNAGGSGCGCSAAVLAGHILKAMADGVWERVLFAATGALMSPTSSQQGESIPGICHALVLEREG